MKKGIGIIIFTAFKKDRKMTFKSWEDERERFEKYLISKGLKPSTIQCYLKAIEKDIPEEIGREVFGEEKSFLINLKKRLSKGGDLYAFNHKCSHGCPSAVVGHYIEFLEKFCFSEEKIEIHSSLKSKYGTDRLEAEKGQN
jgi:hypothetical protein